MVRFIIDAHVHAQRWSPGLLKRGEPFTYPALEHAIMADRAWDNSRALLQDMDRLGISMAVLNTAFNQRNEMIQAQMQRYPDRFVGFTGPVDTLRRAYLWEDKFAAEKAAAECDYWLSKHGFVGIGELVSVLPDPDLDVPIDENLRKMNKIEMPEEHRAMILGLNMAGLCGIDVDQRLWEEQARRYGPQLRNDEVPIDTGWESDY